MPSLHVLIVTLGRPSLQNMLNSILPSLTDVDHLTIIFDGVAPTEINTETKGTVHIFQEEKGRCWPNHAFRNKYSPLLEKTDFVMHADDDDEYTPGAFDVIRSTCTDPETLYIFKMEIVNHKIVPTQHHIVAGEIGTPNGIIPYDLNRKGVWELKYGGDWDFYHSLEPHAKNIEYLDHVIYTYFCRHFM
jgi:hypothetical protein